MNSEQGAKLRVLVAMVEYEDTISALLAIATPAERAEYEAGLAKPEVDTGYNTERFVPPVEKVLRDRLLQKLRSGEWLASGFGYEAGKPTELDPRVWQRLTINVVRNTAGDGMAPIGGPSLTGAFHSLGYRRARIAPEPVGQGERVVMIARVKQLFERLDGELPLSAAKKDFFRKARREFPGVVEGWLKKAWTDAKLRSERRRPGARSDQSNKRESD